MLEKTFLDQIVEYINSAIDKFNSSYEEIDFNIEFDLVLESERGFNLIKLVNEPNCKVNLNMNLKTMIDDLETQTQALANLNQSFATKSQKTLKSLNKLKKGFKKEVKLHRINSKNEENKKEIGENVDSSSASDDQQYSQPDEDNKQANETSEKGLTDIAIKNLRKVQIQGIVDKANQIIKQKNEFSEYFSTSLTCLENLKSHKLRQERIMKKYIDGLDLSVEELKRKEADFGQINNLIHMIRVIIEKENTHIHNFAVKNFKSMYKGELKDLTTLLNRSYIQAMTRSDITEFQNKMQGLSIPRGIIATYKLIQTYYEQAGRRLQLREDQKKAILKQFKEQERKIDYDLDKKAEKIKKELEQTYEIQIKEQAVKLGERLKKINELKLTIKNIKKQSSVNSSSIDQMLLQKDQVIQQLTSQLDAVKNELDSKVKTMSQIQQSMEKDKEYLNRKKNSWRAKKIEYQSLKTSNQQYVYKLSTLESEYETKIKKLKDEHEYYILMIERRSKMNIEDFELQTRRLKDELEINRNRIQLLESNSLASKDSSGDSELEKSRYEIMHLRNIIEDKSSEVIKLRNEVAKSQMLSGDFEAQEKNILENTVQKLKGQLKSLQQKNQLLEQRQEELNQGGLFSGTASNLDVSSVGQGLDVTSWHHTTTPESNNPCQLKQIITNLQNQINDLSLQKKSTEKSIEQLQQENQELKQYNLNNTIRTLEQPKLIQSQSVTTNNSFSSKNHLPIVENSNENINTSTQTEDLKKQINSVVSQIQAEGELSFGNVDLKLKNLEDRIEKLYSFKSNIDSHLINAMIMSRFLSQNKIEIETGSNVVEQNYREQQEEKHLIKKEVDGKMDVSQQHNVNFNTYQ